MKTFAVVGLDTEKRKNEAENTLRSLGYSSDEHWNCDHRNSFMMQTIICYHNGVYCYANHSGGEDQITCDQLKETLKEQA